MFNLLFSLKNNLLFLATETHVFFLDSSTGKIIASSMEGMGQHDDDDVSKEKLPKTHIRVAAYHSPSQILALASDDKEIQIWDLKTFSFIVATKAFKRAMCMRFSTDGKTLYLGDRAGDLYSYEVATLDDPKLLVGHVSILTDFFFSKDEKLLITSDRDEKIRVNFFPDCYEIKQFLLGHLQ
jgi:tRNA (guanine-N(7)-)-methyltransferase subunit TRM82